MSDNKSVFSDDWRDCLEEHYKDVVRRDDKLTEDTLVGVLYDVGFSTDELRQIKLNATMRAEDLASDFVPDLDIHVPEEEPSIHPVVMPPDPEDVMLPEDEMVIEEPDLLSLPDEVVDEIQDQDQEDNPPPDDGPKQMALF